MMKPAVIYARVSSKEQEREGFSIPAQLKLLRDYAIRNDFSVVKEFVDIETAKTSGRQNFDQMVQFFTKNRHCRVVLVEKTDRLYRNFRDAVTLEDLDLEIHLVKEGQVISKDAKSQAKLIHGMQLVLARNYIENLREEVKKGCG
jgi:site-specific DNA recombinase